VNITFQNPSLLILLILLLPVCWLIWKGYNKRENLLHNFTGISSHLTVRKMLVMTLSITMLSSLLILAAGPRQSLDNDDLAQSADFVFLVDVSRSMAARNDCDERTRLARARTIMQEIVRELPGARYGFMAFAKLSFVLAEPSFDREYLLEIIENGLIIETVPFPGSDISNALQVFLEKKTDEPKVFENINNIILFSDGDFSSEDLQELNLAVIQIKDAGVAISVIGIGSDEGVPIPTLDTNRECQEGQYERADGKEFYTHLVEEQLRYLAEETGGAYFHEAQLQGLNESLYSRFEPTDSTMPPNISEDMSVLFMLLATFSFIVLIMIRYM
jgi:Ca-activated chloride channel family protein